MHNIFKNLKIIAVSTCLFASFTASSENASDPTAALNFTDFKIQFFDTGDLSPAGDERDRYAIEGAYVFNPKHKMTYELNYWDTNVTGKSETDFESLKVKYINLTPGMMESGLKYKFAIGAEIIADLGDPNKGIGSGTTQIAPLVGYGFVMSPQDTVITLVQYFHSVDEDDNAEKVRVTGPRVIWIHSFPKYKAWFKLDNKFSINHEDDHATGNTLEVQFGKFIAPKVAVYVEALYGTGGDTSYESGLGIGMRVMY